MAQETKPTDVKVIDPIEQAFYDGVTIDESGKTNFNQKYVNFSRIELGHSHNKWLTRLVWGLIVLAVGAFVVFVALPALLVLVAVALVAWVVFNLTRK